MKYAFKYGFLSILGRWLFLYIRDHDIGYFLNSFDKYLDADGNYQAFLIVFMGCLILNEIKKGNNQSSK